MAFKRNGFYFYVASPAGRDAFFTTGFANFLATGFFAAAFYGFVKNNLLCFLRGFRRFFGIFFFVIEKYCERKIIMSFWETVLSQLNRITARPIFYSKTD